MYSVVLHDVSAGKIINFKMADFDVPGVSQEDDVTLPRGKLDLE